MSSQDHTEENTPSCPHCSSPMIMRVAKRGSNQGGIFWGCPEFPKCKGTHDLKPRTNPPNVDHQDSEPTEEGAGSISTAFDRVLRTIDKVRRWGIEQNEPDATGRWDSEARHKALKYVWKRDDRCCGLCGRKMPLKGGQVEHIAPKVFGFFNIAKGGKAVAGTRYKSQFHKLDNLQAAHSYCNKKKGNTENMKLWRHPTMKPLAIAISQDGEKITAPCRKS